MATFVGYPVSYDTSNSNPSSYGGVGSGYTAANSTTRAAFTPPTTTGSTARIYYNFDTSSIPSNVIITSVSCEFKAAWPGGNGTGNAGTTYYLTRVAQLCSGTNKKGSGTTISATTTAGTVNVQTIADCGEWTVEELRNAKILLEGVRNNSTQSLTVSFYGATLTVEYIEPLVEIVSVSNTDKATIEPSGTFTISSGDSQEFIIRTDNVEGITVTDNGNDVTNSLEERHIGGTDTISATPQSYTASGAVYNSSSVGQSSTAHTLCIGVPSNTTNNSTANVYRPSAQASNTTIDYFFDFSEIPQDATIDSVSVTVKGHIESTSQSQRKAGLRLYAGNTAKGSESNFTSTANTVITMTAGTWTRAELDTAKLRFEIGVYGGLIVGVTFAVSYSLPSETIYVYSLSNIGTDHTIVVKDKDIIIPEDEDSAKTYYSVTISSINATTDPGRGTIRVESGSSLSVTISPTESQFTLLTDNGVDITNELTGGSSPTYNVSNITTQYGFVLCASTGYYTSTNKAVANSAAVSRVNFNLPVRCLVTIQYINYAEATYDFGVFSKVDTALSTSAWVAASNAGDTTTDAGLEQIRLNTSAYNSSAARTLTYEIDAGQHFIDVKYAKDQATNSNNDNLQWKILSIEPLETVTGYTYTLNNISEDHSLIFIFGNVSYYFLEAEGQGCKLYPNGTSVILAGDSYKLSIVPNGYDDRIAVTDNNNDVTQYLTKVESEIEKDGETIAIVNYVYSLSNVSSTHNITVSCSGSKVLLKLTNEWITVKKCFKKGLRGWEEITDVETLFEIGKTYING